jgi:hypothetical protein
LKAFFVTGRRGFIAFATALLPIGFDFLVPAVFLARAVFRVLADLLGAGFRLVAFFTALRLKGMGILSSEKL